MLKKYIQRKIQDKLGITENKILIQTLFAYQSLYSDTIIATPQYFKEKILEDYTNTYGITEANLNIHRNDMMLYNHLTFYNGDVIKALRAYFDTGISNAKKIQQLTEDQPLKEVYDFGSGYGRISRFLPLFMKDINLEVSEIKSIALEFQKKEFGFKTHLHFTDPQAFTIEQKKDLILATSVFTHLPVELAYKWTQKLISGLNTSGKIILTINEISNCPFQNDGHYYFAQQSEDSASHGIYDKIKSTDNYGSTYYSLEHFKNNVIKADKDVQLIPNFSGTQSAIIINA